MRDKLQRITMSLLLLAVIMGVNFVSDIFFHLYCLLLFSVGVDFIIFNPYYTLYSNCQRLNGSTEDRNITSDVNNKIEGQVTYVSVLDPRWVQEVASFDLEVEECTYVDVMWVLGFNLGWFTCLMYIRLVQEMRERGGGGGGGERERERERERGEKERRWGEKGIVTLKILISIIKIRIGGDWI